MCCFSKKGFIYKFSNIFINYTQIEFNKCIELINFNLKAIEKKTLDLNVADDPNQFELNHASLNSTVVKWEEKDVESWINEKQIRSSILDNIRPCNGELLYELFSIKMKAPDFFYETLMTSDNSVDQFTLRDYAVFFNELKKLFLL